MKDGTYSLQFSADGYVGRGTFVLQQNRGHGHDRKFRIEGHLIEHGANLTAVVNVLMLPAAAMNTRLPHHYSLSMSGTATANAFSLIGVGPLGIIIDLEGEWLSESLEGIG